MILAAPKLGLILFDDGTFGDVLPAVRLKQLINTEQVKWFSGKRRYRYDGGKFFRIVCSSCHGSGCNSPKIRKLGEHYGQGSDKWQSHFSHESTAESNHEQSCYCWDNPKSQYRKPSISWRSIESRVYIPAHIHSYEGERKHPMIIELMYPSEMDAELRESCKKMFF